MLPSRSWGSTPSFFSWSACFSGSTGSGSSAAACSTLSSAPLSRRTSRTLSLGISIGSASSARGWVGNGMRRLLRSGGLLGLGTLVARPGAGETRHAVAGPVVGEAAHEPEDRALDHERGEQLHEAAGLAVLRVGRLVLVDEAPDLLEDLAPEDAGGEAEGDAERREDELHGSVVVLHVARVARLEERLLVLGAHAALNLTPALDLGVDLGAVEDHVVRDPQPREEHDHAAERAVGLVVGAEVRDVEREQRRGDDPQDDGDQ